VRTPHYVTISVASCRVSLPPSLTLVLDLIAYASLLNVACLRLKTRMLPNFLLLSLLTSPHIWTSYPLTPVTLSGPAFLAAMPLCPIPSSPTYAATARMKSRLGRLENALRPACRPELVQRLEISPLIPYLQLYLDGIACRLCQPLSQPYICRSERSMRVHLKQTHKWQSGNKGGSPQRAIHTQFINA
jgi:hypothetical protein